MIMYTSEIVRGCNNTGYGDLYYALFHTITFFLKKKKIFAATYRRKAIVHAEAFKVESKIYIWQVQFMEDKIHVSCSNTAQRNKTKWPDPSSKAWNANVVIFLPVNLSGHLAQQPVILQPHLYQ